MPAFAGARRMLGEHVDPEERRAATVRALRRRLAAAGFDSEPLDDDQVEVVARHMLAGAGFDDGRAKHYVAAHLRRVRAELREHDVDEAGLSDMDLEWAARSVLPPAVLRRLRDDLAAARETHASGGQRAVRVHLTHEGLLDRAGWTVHRVGCVQAPADSELLSPGDAVAGPAVPRTCRCCWPDAEQLFGGA